MSKTRSLFAPKRRAPRLMAGAGLLAIALSMPAAAQEKVWTGEANSIWSNPENWSGGTVPDATDAVTIDGAGEAPRIVGEDVIVSAITVGADGKDGELLILAPVGQTSTLTSTGRPTENGLPRDFVGQRATGTVTLSGAGARWTNTAGVVNVGSGEGGRGTLILREGAAATMRSLVFGNDGGVGELRMASGARLDSEGLGFGMSAGSVGSLVVNDSVLNLGQLLAGFDGGIAELGIAFSEVAIAGNLSLGSYFLGGGENSDAALNLNQVLMTVGRDVNLGQGGGRGAIYMTGGALSIDGTLRVGGGYTGASANSLTETGTGELFVSGGVLLSEQAQIGYGAGSVGEVVLSEGAAWTNRELLVVGGDGGEGKLTLSGATLETETLGIGFFSLTTEPGSGRGDLVVNGGSRLTAETVAIGVGAPASATISGEGTLVETDIFYSFGAADARTSSTTVTDGARLAIGGGGMEAGTDLIVGDGGVVDLTGVFQMGLPEGNPRALSPLLSVNGGTANLDTGILIATRGEVQVVGATSYLGGASGLVQLSGSALEVSDGARFEPGLLLAYASGDAFSQITFAGGAQIRTGAEGADFDLTGIFGSDVLVDGESTVWEGGAMLLADTRFTIANGAYVFSRAGIAAEDPEIFDGTTYVGGAPGLTPIVPASGPRGTLVTVESGALWDVAGDLQLINPYEASGIVSRLAAGSGGEIYVMGSLLAGQGPGTVELALDSAHLTVDGDLMFGLGSTASGVSRESNIRAQIVSLGRDGGTGTLQLTDGRLVSANLLVGGGSGPGGDTTGSGLLVVGGSARVTNAGQFVIGSLAGSVGRVEVAGSGSRIDSDGFATFGFAGGTATLLISDRGTVTIGDQLAVAGGASRVEVRDTDSLLVVEQDLSLAGGTLAVLDQARADLGGLTVYDGATLALGNTAMLASTTIALEDGAALAFTIENGGIADGAGAAQAGTITIGDNVGLTVTASDAPALGGRYVVLAAENALTGTFAFDQQYLTAFAGLDVTYTDRAAILEFAQLRELADAALTPNQRAAAAGADALALANPLKSELLLLPDDGTARQAFDALSGEIHASAESVLIEDLQMPQDLVLERLASGPQGGLWGRGYAASGQFDGNDNAAPLEYDGWSLVMGGDLELGRMSLGLAASYGEGTLDLAARSSDADREVYQVLAYGRAGLGPLDVRLLGGYAHAKLTSVRRVRFGGFDDVLRSGRSGDAGFGAAELALPTPATFGSFEPFVGVSYASWSLDDGAETGGAAALAFEQGDLEQLRSRLGMRLALVEGDRLRVTGKAVWMHDFGDLAPQVRTTLAGGAAATIEGAATSRNAAILALSGHYAISDRVSITVGYDGMIGDRGVTNRFSLGLAGRF